MNEKEELENNLRNVNPPSYPSPSYKRVVIQDDMEMQSKEDALKEKELALLEKKIAVKDKEIVQRELDKALQIKDQVSSEKDVLLQKLDKIINGIKKKIDNTTTSKIGQIEIEC